MIRTAAALLMTATTSLAAVRAYSVAPRTAQLSGWTHGERGYVSEVLTVNFDEPVTAALFCGAPGAGGRYCVSIQTYPGSYEVARGDTTDPGVHRWATCTLDVIEPDSFIKGRQVEVRWTRSGHDSIQYHASLGTSYLYGFMRTNGTDHSELDLCMGLAGQLDPVDSLLCGMDDEGPLLVDSAARRDRWVQRARDAKAGAFRRYIWWQDVESESASFWFQQLDTALLRMINGADCEMLACLVGCPKWASTRTVWDSTNERLDTSTYCAPRNMFVDPASDLNHWARYLLALIKNTDAVGCTLHAFEIWNEPNDGDTTREVTGWWQHPNRFYSDSISPSAHDMCYLYLKMCRVAAQVIRAQGGHAGDRIIIGSTARIEDENAEQCLVKGSEWVRLCYEIAQEKGWGIFWDGVSVHAYQGWLNGKRFDPEFYQANIDAIRAIMRQAGHYGGELWNTEIGWDTTDADTARNADNLCETFVSSMASVSQPQGGFDRTFWWGFREYPQRLGYFPLLDTGIQHPYKLFYACKQMMARLKGKRLNGRVLTGDVRDDSVRMYEFEDPATLRRTWVCWENGGSGSGAPVGVRIPLESDRLIAESLAYRDGRPPTFAVLPGADGWLSLALDERPVFISEQSVPNRPDLVVDSVRVVPVDPRVGGLLTMRAWVRNQGTKVTPQGYATRVLFAADGDSIGSAEVSEGVAVGQTVLTEFRLSQVPSGMSGPVLFAATANPGQRYVELDMDNNTAYTQVVIE